LSVTLAAELVTEHLSNADRRQATVDRLLDELEALATSTSSASAVSGSSPASKGES
jgi:hypothetical protein